MKAEKSDAILLCYGEGLMDLSGHMKYWLSLLEIELDVIFWIVVYIKYFLKNVLWYIDYLRKGVTFSVQLRLYQ